MVQLLLGEPSEFRLQALSKSCKHCRTQLVHGEGGVYLHAIGAKVQ